jgi:integrase
MPSVYVRLKVDGKGWRYRAVPPGRGRRPDWVKSPFYVRFTDPRGKQVWSEPQTTIEKAQELAEQTADVLKAHAKGLTVKEAQDIANANRTPIKVAVERFLDLHRNDRPKTVQQYTNALNHLLENLPKGVRFIDQLGTQHALNDYLRSLEDRYAPKTIETRMGVVFSLLKDHRKETGVEEPSKLVKLPKVQTVKAKAYSKEELQKLFGAMNEAEYLRYLFFVHTGCREQEVQFATWDDLDFTKNTFTVTGVGKSDAGFVPKSWEERTVPLTTELAELLQKYRKASHNKRWVFANEDGKPEGHFLRKFKAIAKRAGLNCGRCKTTIRDGKYDNRKEIAVTCETRPVCEKHYLHRLRKTAATRWIRSGIDIMRIKSWLGHKNLNVTQIYLSDESAPDEQHKIDSAGKF